MGWNNNYNYVISGAAFIVAGFVMTKMLSDPDPVSKKIAEAGLLDMTPLWNYSTAEKLFEKIGDEGRENYSHHADFKFIGDMTFPLLYSISLGFLIKARYGK